MTYDINDFGDGAPIPAHRVAIQLVRELEHWIDPWPPVYEWPIIDQQGYRTGSSYQILWLGEPGPETECNAAVTLVGQGESGLVEWVRANTLAHALHQFCQED